tara:strand:+ start:214 stop:642 length:429 start_codon:yes stop_codon:yes gene_type:complete
MEFVIKNSNVGKSVLSKINELDKSNLEKLKIRENELKKQEENIQKKKNIISKEELEKEINNLKKNVNNFRIEKDSMVKKINEIKKRELSQLYQSINPVIQSYMDENKINILLDVKNIIIGKSNYNITDEIIDILNVKLTKIN